MGFLTYVYGGVTSTPAGAQVSVFDQPELFGGDLEPYKGNVILVVNTASQCGFAGQYDGLEGLYQKYSAQGLVVVGAPSNDFLRQEPGSDAEIQSVCRLNHGVTFPLLRKASVKGIHKQPLFEFLTEHGPQDLRGSVTWNFEKFLLDRDGHLIGRWRSYVAPQSRAIVNALERALGEKRRG
jgi:glutathione peroxidase